MKNLQITKEYNHASSTLNNMDVFDIYINDWGVLQYGFKYNEFHELYEIHFMTTGKRVTGLTYEKMDKVLKKELEYQIDRFRKAKRI
ncbi:hypothetical protein [Staphylococcus phage PT1-4]